MSLPTPAIAMRSPDHYAKAGKKNHPTPHSRLRAQEELTNGDLSLPTIHALVLHRHTILQLLPIRAQHRTWILCPRVTLQRDIPKTADRELVIADLPRHQARALSSERRVRRAGLLDGGLGGDPGDDLVRVRVRPAADGDLVGVWGGRLLRADAAVAALGDGVLLEGVESALVDVDAEDHAFAAVAVGGAVGLLAVEVAWAAVGEGEVPWFILRVAGYGVIEVCVD